MSINNTTDDTITVCPHCDSNSGLRYRNGHHNPSREGYYCEQCKRDVPRENLEEREPRNHGSRHGLSKTLVDMDPDDL